MINGKGFSFLFGVAGGGLAGNRFGMDHPVVGVVVVVATVATCWIFLCVDFPHLRGPLRKWWTSL